MKETFLLAVIVVLLQCVLSQRNLEDPIVLVRHNLRIRGGHLLLHSKDLGTLRPSRTISLYLNEVNEKEWTMQSWMQKVLGYSPEPGSFTRQDELIVATEYHLWQSTWYQLRFVALAIASEREGHAGDRYPRKDVCRNAALKAFEHVKKHKELYNKCLQALDEKARLGIMKVPQLPNYVGFEKQNHQFAEIDAFSSVRLYLEEHFKRLYQRKASQHLSAAKDSSVIGWYLSPSQMTLDEYFMLDLGKFFPLEVLSQSPDKASRTDKEFLEIGWLFNRYRSLWYEIRHNAFSKFVLHGKPGRRKVSTKRVEDAINFTKERFELYLLLSNEYRERFEKFQPVIDQNNLIMEGDGQIHISEDEGLEPIQCRVKRKRTALNWNSKDSAGTHERQSLNEDLESVGSNRLKVFANVARPDIDLNKPPPETGDTEGDLCLVDALLDSHSNLALCANKNNQQLHDAIEMDSVASKRLKVTVLEDNCSRVYPNLDGVLQSSSEKCTLRM